MTNTVTKLGIVFVLLGTVAMLAPVLGISSLTADRGVQVNAAETPATAYLGITDQETSEVTRTCTGFFTRQCESNEVDAIELENNIQNSFGSITVEVASVSGADDSILQVANDGELSTLDPEDPLQPVSLACGNGGGTASNAEVTFLIDAEGSGLSVTEATYTVGGISYDCDEDDSAGDGKLTDDPIPINDPDIDLQVVEGTPEALAPTGYDDGQGNSRVNFELENTGTNDATVTGITVTDASDSTHINMLDDGFIFPIAGDEVTVDATGTINLEGSLQVGTNRYNLSSPTAITNGESVVVDIEQFRDGENGGTYNQVDMQGKTVTLVLYVEGANSNEPNEEIPVEITLDL
ncbi:hypothetical protein [Natrinema sp. H-ect4]|uniref:hypothetical protein n=1 Tax=Natrinema sp. H-ect4 TaxID=3242699 RepID=UPI0035A97889